jgi:hypothetical protein
MKLTKPRIIGIILLVIAILVYFTGKTGSIMLSILGALLLIAPTKHANKMFDTYIENYSKLKTVIITALYDAIYWLIIFGGAFFFQYLIQGKIAGAQAALVTQQEMMKPEIIGPGADALKNFVIFIFTGGAVFLIFACLIYGISRAFIWSTISKQKPDKKYLLRFIILNAAWWAVWLPLYIIINLALKNDPRVKEAMVVLLFVGYYFTPLVHTLYVKKHQIGYSIGNGIAWGISKIHKLIIPYTYVFITYIILYQIYRLAEQTAWAKPVSILFIIIFIAWVRTYLYDIIKEFK